MVKNIPLEIIGIKCPKKRINFVSLKSIFLRKALNINPLYKSIPLGIEIATSVGKQKDFESKRSLPMSIAEGDKFRDKLTGQSFIVKKIMDRTIILEAEDTPNRFCLSDGIVELFFDKTENKKTVN